MSRHKAWSIASRQCCLDMCSFVNKLKNTLDAVRDGIFLKN